MVTGRDTTEDMLGSNDDVIAAPKVVVLTFTEYYLPGFKGGGPIRTVSNMLDELGHEIAFSLVTSDRDFGDLQTYSGVAVDQWQSTPSGEVYYASPKLNYIFKLWHIIKCFSPKILYLNSFFSLRFSILPLLLWRLSMSTGPVILGPRGEFSQGALELKSIKKNAYVVLSKLLGLYSRIIWHASTEAEADDIRRVMGNKARIRVAVDIACPPRHVKLASRKEGTPLRIVFLSRVSPKKNLRRAIEILQNIRCGVIFDVYGPLEDTGYWASCQIAAKELPPHVRFNYGGLLHPAQVPDILAQYDLFYFPTLGENFGHVIAEALGCGLPILISDATPWRSLHERKLGWDVSLADADQFVARIEECQRIPAIEYDAWRRSIRSWALENIGSKEAVEQNRRLFMNLESTHEY